MTPLPLLRRLNDRLTGLLNDPQPGLAVWSREVTRAVLGLAELGGSFAIQELARVELRAMEDPVGIVHTNPCRQPDSPLPPDCASEVNKAEATVSQ